MIASSSAHDKSSSQGGQKQISMSLMEYNQIEVDGTIKVINKDLIVEASHKVKVKAKRAQTNKRKKSSISPMVAGIPNNINKTMRNDQQQKQSASKGKNERSSSNNVSANKSGTNNNN